MAEGRRRRSETRRRPTLIGVRVTEEEHAQLQERARAGGYSVPGLLRDRGLDAAPEVQVVRIQPGDVLVVITSEQVSMHYTGWIKKRVEEVWPGQPCVVLPAAGLAVLRADLVVSGDSQST
jgi:acyl CoA:acetate/3-ketoacid CoA transferase alpha subunit